MRFIFYLSVFISLLSCDDGGFEVPSFEFEPTIYSCGTYVLHRSNTDQTEALIVLLDEADIVQEVGNKQIAITADNVIYRIFDNSISPDYFCAAIPPTTPHVTKEWRAATGSSSMIVIETTEIIEDDTTTIIGYKHDIVLQNLVLTSNDETMTFESYGFGSLTTSVLK